MTELALRSDVPGSLSEQMELAKALATSQIIPNHLAGKPANILAIMFAANAVGVPLWTAMQSMQVINGKVGISADLARALILNRGHSFRVVESTTERATVEVVRKGEEYVHSATFTIDDARTAHLAGKGAWLTYPLAMLVARATTLVARQACADVLAGMSYTPEELGADVDEEGRITEDSGASSSSQSWPAPNPECGKCHFFHRPDGVCPPGEPGPGRNKDGSVDQRKLPKAVKTQRKQADAAHEALVAEVVGEKVLWADPVLNDQFLDNAGAPPLDLPTPDSVKLTEQMLTEIADCVTVEMVETARKAAQKARADDRILMPQLGTLIAAASSRTRELLDEQSHAATG